MRGFRIEKIIFWPSARKLAEKKRGFFSAASSARTPGTTSTIWFSASCCRMFITLPPAPAFWIGCGIDQDAANRASTIAPAHIAQGFQRAVEGHISLSASDRSPVPPAESPTFSACAVRILVGFTTIESTSNNFHHFKTAIAPMGTSAVHQRFFPLPPALTASSVRRSCAISCRYHRAGLSICRRVRFSGTA